VGLDTVFPILSPRLSPDGTRLLLASSQVYAARRNMNLPPRITQVGGVAVDDTAATIAFTVFSDAEPTVKSIGSSDPEDDDITCSAFFLESWMSFSNCALVLDPPGAVSGRFYVKLQISTESGGADMIIAIIDVNPSLARSPAEPELVEARAAAAPGPNPTRGRFAIPTPWYRDGTATLFAFDVAGRRVARVSGRAGEELIWDGKDGMGAQVPTGIYLYRMSINGRLHAEGKVVVVK